MNTRLAEDSGQWRRMERDRRHGLPACGEMLGDERHCGEEVRTEYGVSVLRHESFDGCTDAMIARERQMKAEITRKWQTATEAV